MLPLTVPALAVTVPFNTEKPTLYVPVPVHVALPTLKFTGFVHVTGFGQVGAVTDMPCVAPQLDVAVKVAVPLMPVTVLVALFTTPLVLLTLVPFVKYFTLYVPPVSQTML